MPTISGFNGDAVNLSTAQAGNGVSTNIAQRRRFDQGARAAVLRIVAATGTACSYLIEGSADNAAYFPLLSVPLLSGAEAVAVTNVGLITIAAPATLWRLIPVDIPFTFLRVTYSANTAIVNTTDIWVY